jgi:hypothetical protein
VDGFGIDAERAGGGFGAEPFLAAMPNIYGIIRQTMRFD